MDFKDSDRTELERRAISDPKALWQERKARATLLAIVVIGVVALAGLVGYLVYLSSTAQKMDPGEKALRSWRTIKD
jgi:hypothetical protein